MNYDELLNTLEDEFPDIKTIKSNNSITMSLNDVQISFIFNYNSILKTIQLNNQYSHYEKYVQQLFNENILDKKQLIQQIFQLKCTPCCFLCHSIFPQQLSSWESSKEHKLTQDHKEQLRAHFSGCDISKQRLNQIFYNRVNNQLKDEKQDMTMKYYQLAILPNSKEEKQQYYKVQNFHFAKQEIGCNNFELCNRFIITDQQMIYYHQQCKDLTQQNE